jgi:hypothetical protein
LEVKENFIWRKRKSKSLPAAEESLAVQGAKKGACRAAPEKKRERWYNVEF